MRPNSCSLRNSLEVMASEVSQKLKRLCWAPIGTRHRANKFSFLVRKFLSKQISDTTNGTEITEGANWQEIF